MGTLSHSSCRAAEFRARKPAGRQKQQRVDEERMRPPRTNSTEGPIDAFDQRNGCNRVETRETER
jgi:hypothetical protein